MTNKLLKETVAEELKSLEEQQTQALEDLAVENVNDVVDMENELKNIKHAAVADIEDQMEKQKENVCLNDISNI